MNKLRFIGLCVIAILSGGAGVSDKADIKRQCDYHYATLKVEVNAEYLGKHTRWPPRYPFNYPNERYVCVMVEFDINKRGRTENIQAIFIAPEDASSRFSKSAVRAVKRWRYDPPINEPEMRLEDRVAMVTFETY